MRIAVVLFCISTLTWWAQAGSEVETSLLEAFETLGRFAGVGDIVEEMTQTFKAFSQVSAFLKNDENIRHITFVMSVLEQGIQEGCSVWKNSQEIVNGDGLREYVQEVKKRTNDRLLENEDLPRDMISFVNQNINPVLDGIARLVSDFSVDQLPLKPSYAQVAQLIGFASAFRMSEVFNPELLQQAVDSVGNPLTIIAKEVEKHLAPEQIRLLTSMLAVVQSQRRAQPVEKDEL